MLNMMRTYLEAYLAPYVKDEEGQGMVEYGLLVSLISIAAITAIVAIGPPLLAAFQGVADNL